MNNTDSKFAELVRLELQECAKLGMRGAKRAVRLTYAPDFDYEYGNMIVSECASLLMELS